MHAKHLDLRRGQNDREAGYPEYHSRGGSVLTQILIWLSQALKMEAAIKVVSEPQVRELA